MNKVASIFGIGMISMAVALTPAFAQQAKSGENLKVGSTSGKSDTGVKEDKSIPAKPGNAVKSEDPKKDKAVQSKSSEKQGRHGKLDKNASSKGADHKHQNTEDLNAKTETEKTPQSNIVK